MNPHDGPRGDALIVMEMVTSHTLQRLLDDVTQTVTRGQRLQFAKEVTAALDYLHNKHVAHLDVKPKNVLMTSSNSCKLADFGSLTQTQRGAAMEESEYTQLLGLS